MFLLAETVLVILIAGSIAFYIACAVCTHQYFSNSAPEQPPLTSAVSILVPVCGLDEGAWQNWSSLCSQSHPEYEVLFGVADPNDAAIPILHQLKAAFGDRVRLFINLPPRGLNYKDSTLSYLLERARYDVLIFVDSDICVKSNYIQTVTAPLADPAIGMVTCAYLGHQPRYLSAALASSGRAFDFIPSLLLARQLDGGLRGAIGTTIATRRDALEHYGGLHLNRIGSDYNLGKRAFQAGYRVELSHLVLESDTGNEELNQLWKRELRWARTIRFNRGSQYYGMIFCYGTVYCLPLLLLSGFANWAIALTFFTLMVRLAQVAVSIICLKCPKLYRWLWVLPLRDTMSFTIWLLGTFGRKVYWRGRRLKVVKDGLLADL